MNSAEPLPKAATPGHPAPGVANTIVRGATAVITHRLHPGHQARYERWLDEIIPLCRSQPGHMDTQVVRPIPGVTDIYTVIIRFESPAHMDQWLASPTRRALITRIQPSLADGDHYETRSGLDFLFAGAEPAVKAPVRWKQWLVTWSVIYPLVLVVPIVLLPLFQVLGLPTNRYFVALLSTAMIVGLMVYVIMPRYTRLVRRWLFR